MKIKENIKKIKKSLEVLSDCVEIKKQLHKDTLHDELDKMTVVLNDLRNTAHKMGFPQPVPNPDFTSLIEACGNYLVDICTYDESEVYENLSHSIINQALKSIYGEDIFKWIMVQEENKE